MRSVFDDLEAMSVGEVQDRIHIARQAGDVDGQDHTGCIRDRGRHALRRHIQRVGVNVNEHRVGPKVTDHLCRRGKRVGSGDDLIARADAAGLKSQMQTGCGRVDADGFETVPHELGKLVLESPCLRPGRQPAGAERIDDLLDLGLAYVRYGEW